MTSLSDINSTGCPDRTRILLRVSGALLDCNLSVLPVAQNPFTDEFRVCPKITDGQLAIVLDPDVSEPQCPHDEHDHGICLSCGVDITQSLVEKSENAADAAQDR